MAVDSFGEIGRRISEHQGEQFFTRSGLPMTYEVVGFSHPGEPSGAVAVNGRRDGDLGKMVLDATLTDVDQRITGHAYLFAILRDERIRGE